MSSCAASAQRASAAGAACASGSHAPHHDFRQDRTELGRRDPVRRCRWRTRAATVASEQCQCGLHRHASVECRRRRTGIPPAMLWFPQGFSRVIDRLARALKFAAMTRYDNVHRTGALQTRRQIPRRPAELTTPETRFHCRY